MTTDHGFSSNGFELDTGFEAASSPTIGVPVGQGSTLPNASAEETLSLSSLAPAPDPY
jgi:hypothetical protein